ncbi:MAG: nickel pincer cofactor biosynthesis protein LarC [Deltaproteobacteria bacterium]|nr:nickel pincer cofactor biosynthesis protein LarC [Deltaproteobacteria bacterium]
MRIAYFDCFSGISGNMVLGALIDLGLPREAILSNVEKLGLEGYRVEVSKVSRGPIGATHVEVFAGEGEGHAHRTFRDVRALIEGAPLEAAVREASLKVFRRLAEAEAKVHRTDPDSVTFHEVGAVDAIIDVVGSCAGLVALGVERIHCSPLPLGGGSVPSRHGELPLPAPATVELLTGMAVHGASDPVETVTPTGAALMATLAAGTGVFPPMRVDRVGYGAGDDRATRLPNVLRVVLGETEEPLEGDAVSVIETNIDDLNPEIYDFLSERLVAAGALDVSLSPLQMKKGRPGTLLRVIGAEADRARLAEVIFRESSAIGVRVTRAERIILPRRTIEVDTPHGRVRVKLAGGEAGIRSMHPEYDDCRRCAEATGVPLKEVIEAAHAAARERLSSL